MSKSSYEVDVRRAVSEYADMVYRLARVKTNGSADVDDIFQNTFLKLLKYKGSISSEEHLKAWLIRVTISECNAHLGSTWNKKKAVLDDAYEVATAEEEDFSEVTEAVLKLPEKYRDIIHLYYYEELSIKEIAAVTELSEGGVKTRLKRGREFLEKSLKGGVEL